MKTKLTVVSVIMLVIITMVGCGGSGGGGGEDKPKPTQPPARFEVLTHSVFEVNGECFQHYIDMGYTGIEAINACGERRLADDEPAVVGNVYIFEYKLLNENQNTDYATMEAYDNNNNHLTYTDTLYFDHQYDIIWFYVKAISAGEGYVDLWAVDKSGRNTDIYSFDITIVDPEQKQTYTVLKESSTLMFGEAF